VNKKSRLGKVGILCSFSAIKEILHRSVGNSF
jgi:hypothetical protein